MRFFGHDIKPEAFITGVLTHAAMRNNIPNLNPYVGVVASILTICDGIKTRRPVKLSLGLGLFSAAMAQVIIESIQSMGEDHGVHQHTP